MAKPAPLFLDAARLGTMSPSAQRAARDFARLAGEGRSMLYWENFLRYGFSPSRSPPKLPGLIGWRGVPCLRNAVRQLFSASPDTPVLFASRSTALMQSAVRILASRCRRILTTDTLWPPYLSLLDSQCSSAGTFVQVTSIRDNVVAAKLSRRDLVRQIIQAFSAASHDGVVISSVSHEGIRLPLAPLLSALRGVNPDVFIVVDGAQEVAHVPTNFSKEFCDIYVAGCHKWLGAYQPLGISLLPNPTTAPSVDGEFRVSPVDDSLFNCLGSLEGQTSAQSTETANLTPLLCAWGAFSDLCDFPHAQFSRFRCQLKNVRQVATEAPAIGWTALRLPVGLRSGIILLRPTDPSCCELPIKQLQNKFADAGVLLTVHPPGMIRLSLPARKLRASEWRVLRRAFRSCASLP